ncbi:MAG: head GIN domain-containing protein [Lentimicrobium sp.]|nr:head GIN domain-containing protein [Lentimicrobium sp.]
MKRSISLIVWTVFLPVCCMVLSCNREQLDDCYTNTGPQETVMREVGVFHTIELYDNVNLVLTQGNSFQIMVEGGANILSAIKTEVVDSMLMIHNTMKCNWVRSYDREITVYATVPVIRELIYEGSGDVSTEGQIKLDSLQLSIWGGAGSFTLDLDVKNLKLALHYGTADVTVKGKALITTIFANSFGPFYCSELISNITYVRNSGTNNCYVYARHILEVEIPSVGDVYYSGDPYDIKMNVTGSGKLIKSE